MHPQTLSESTKAIVDLRLLGGFSLATPNGVSIDLPTRKSELLLAYLAMPHGIAHSRDKLANLLWPRSQETQARGSLRHAVSALRKVLGTDVIANERDGVALRPGFVHSDVATLATVAKDSAPPDTDEVIRLCEAEFLAGFAGEGEEHDDWLIFERTRCRNLGQAVLERLVDSLLAEGKSARAVAYAQKLVTLDPLREQSHRLLMLVYSDLGERSKALQHFNKLRDLLAKELRVAPSPQTAALAKKIAERDAGACVDTNSIMPSTPVLPTTPVAYQSARISIAVLPFASQGGGEAITALAEGFASDLVAGLSRLSELAVISWESSQLLSGKIGQAANSAETLAVQYAVTGSIRTIGTALRVTAQLIATASREWIWAERFDAPVTDIFAVQDEIVERILGSIDATVKQAEREGALKRNLSNLDAWGLYHRGMWHIYRFTPADVTIAEELFKRAIALAPSSAAPHVGLAYAAIVRAQWFFTDDILDTFIEGMKQAQQALVIDASDPNARTVMGRLLTVTGNTEQARQHLNLAIELNPSLAHAYYGLALAFYYGGRAAEALPPIEKALRLSPKDPMASMFTTLKAFCHFALGDWDAAEHAAHRATTLNTRETWSRLALATVLQARGQYEQASGMIEEARNIEPKLSMTRFAILVQHVQPDLRERVLVQLRAAGLE